MKYGANLVLALAGVGLGAALGVAWEKSHHETRSEDVVSAEVSLLQRSKGVPTCEQINATALLKGEATVGEASVRWIYDRGKHRLQRVVVDPALTTAYEELDLECAPSKP